MRFVRIMYVMKKMLLGCSLLVACFFAIANTSFAYTEVSSEMSPPSVELTNVDIYPNPAKEVVFLKFEEQIARDVSVEVRSFIGNKMATSPTVQQTNLIKINIGDLPAGHYYAIITYEGAKTLKKFIKKA
ncbi:MAG: hypothetical protein ACJAT1_002329 [Marivirga sp.]